MKPLKINIPRLVKIAFYTCLVTILSACHSFNPTSAYSTTENFSKLSSYSWLPEIGYERSGVIRTQPAIGESIRISVDKILATKGFHKADREPDFYVVFHLPIEKSFSNYDLNRFYTSPVGTTNSYWQTWTDPYAITREFQRGTIIVDVIKREKLELVWRGTTETGLFTSSDSHFDPVLAEKAIDAMLELFPPW